MRVQKLLDGCVAIDFDGEEDRLDLFVRAQEGVRLELHDGLAEELLAALRALLEKKP